MFNRRDMVDCNEVHHSEEESYNERAGNSEREWNHTYKVSKQDGKEKVEQHGEVLLLTNVKVFLNDRAN